MGSREVIETVCGAMGLMAFSGADIAGCDAAMRLVLVPAFHPEVLVTFTSRGHENKVEARAFTDVLRHHPDQRPPNVAFAFRVPSEVSERMFLLAIEAHDCVRRHGVPAMLDGMGYDCLLRIGGQDCVFGGNAAASGGRADVDFVRAMLEACYENMPVSRCRNLLAQAATYVDINLKQDDLPAEAPTTKIVVLGDAEDVGALRRGISAVADTSSDAGDLET